MNLTFLGAGVFGQALAKIAAQNGHTITFYDPYKYPEITLSAATKNSEALFFTAPSSAAPDILPNLPLELPLIIASKGFLSLAPFKNFQNLSALGGAAFARDLETQKPTIPNQNGLIELDTTSKLAATALKAPWLEIKFHAESKNHEVTKGILLCGALKNVYAIGAGLFCPDPSSLENYLKQVTPELSAILETNHADPTLIHHSCGLPDLRLSCTPDSRNFTFGRQFRTAHKNLQPATENLQPIAKNQQSAPETTSSNKIQQGTTVEGLSVIKIIKSTPDFHLPANLTILPKIIIAIASGNLQDSPALIQNSPVSAQNPPASTQKTNNQDLEK